jgi:hypothetical protein
VKRRSVFLASLITAGILGAGATFVAATGGAKAAGSAATAVTALPGSWGTAANVPGTSAKAGAGISAVSCAPGAGCTAVGSGLSNAPFFMTENHGTWSKPQALPGLSALGASAFPELTALSCPAPGECLAAGSYGPSTSKGFTIREAKGAWGKAAPIPGLSALATAGVSVVTAVACSAAGNCAVGGGYESGPSANPVLNGWIANLFGGAWKAAKPVPGLAALNVGGAEVTAVSCTSPSNCAAGGMYLPAAPPASTATGLKGTSALNSALSARAAGARAAIQRALRTAGQLRKATSPPPPPPVTAGPRPFAASEVNGAWNSAKPAVPALASTGIGLVTALSCPVTGHCYIAGIADDDTSNPANHPYSFLASQNGAGWNPPAKFPALAIFAFACPAGITGNCTAGGTDTSGVAAVMRDVNGTWGKVTELPGTAKLTYKGKAATSSGVTDLACPSAANCTAGGSFGIGPADSPTAQQVLVAGEANGSWAAAGVPGGMAALNTGGVAEFRGLACSSAANCALGGDYATTSDNQGAFTLAEIPLQPTTTALGYTPTSIHFGQETAEHISVTVTAKAGTAGGKVTVASGTKVICVITLKSGKGACTLTAKQLPAGTYHLVATYPGAFGFAKSVSGSKKLVVS